MKKALLITSMVLISMLVNGLVLKVLWRWFISSTFSLPELSLPTAIGISIFGRLVTVQDISKISKVPIEEVIFLTFAIPIFALGTGAIVALFI